MAICDLRNLSVALESKMSALTPKADMCSASRHVRFEPEADISQTFGWPSLTPSNSCFRIENGHPLPRRMTAPNPLRGLVFRHCNYSAGERAVGLSQLIQNREVIGVGDRYQVA